MQRTLILMTLVALPAAFAGCKKSDPSSAPPGPAAGPQPAEVSYEVRGEGGAFSKGIAESGSFTAGKNTLELRGGRVLVNGKDRGPVKGGDSVVLDEKGQLSVNGTTRPAD